MWFTHTQHALLLRAETVAKEAKEEYEAVTRRVLAEFDVFSQQKLVDMRDVLLNYAQVPPIHPICLTHTPNLSHPYTQPISPIHPIYLTCATCC